MHVRQHTFLDDRRPLEGRQRHNRRVLRQRAEVIAVQQQRPVRRPNRHTALLQRHTHVDHLGPAEARLVRLDRRAREVRRRHHGIQRIYHVLRQAVSRCRSKLVKQPAHRPRELILMEPDRHTLVRVDHHTHVRGGGIAPRRSPARRCAIRRNRRDRQIPSHHGLPVRCRLITEV